MLLLSKSCWRQAKILKSSIKWWGNPERAPLTQKKGIAKIPQRVELVSSITARAIHKTAVADKTAALNRVLTVDLKEPAWVPDLALAI
jgi:hypothetical protein